VRRSLGQFGRPDTVRLVGAGLRRGANLRASARSEL